MAKTNLQVAQAFVNNHPNPCTGSNTAYGRHARAQGRETQITRTFTSYKTVVAVIINHPDTIAEQLWWMDYRSQSTMRQLSYVHSAWHHKHINADERRSRTFCVANPLAHGGRENILPLMSAAEAYLQKMLAPRIRTETKINNWVKFLTTLAEAERIAQEPPGYGYATMFAADEYRLAVLKDIRGGDTHDGALTSLTDNPVGLAEVILRTRAIIALEG